MECSTGRIEFWSNSYYLCWGNLLIHITQLSINQPLITLQISRFLVTSDKRLLFFCSTNFLFIWSSAMRLCSTCISMSKNSCYFNGTIFCNHWWAFFINFYKLLADLFHSSCLWFFPNDLSQLIPLHCT